VAAPSVFLRHNSFFSFLLFSPSFSVEFDFELLWTQPCRFRSLLMERSKRLTGEVMCMAATRVRRVDDAEIKAPSAETAQLSMLSSSNPEVGQNTALRVSLDFVKSALITLPS